MSQSHNQVVKFESGFLSELLNQLPSYVFWKNREGIYLGCNDAFAKSVGLSSAADVIGKNDYDLPIKKEDSNAYRKDDREVMEVGRPKLNIEEEQSFSDGSRKFLLTNKVPLYKDGEVIGLLGVYSDITDLRNTQAELKKANDQAQIAIKTKDDFIANMSHDIRTPITGMLGLIESWKNRAPTPNDKEDAQLLEDCTKELLNLLNGVIDIIRMDAHTVIENSLDFNLEKVINHNITLLLAAAKDKGIKLYSDIAPNVPIELSGKKMLVDRILLNLIGNAIKFTSQGHVAVVVSLVEQKDQCARISFVIEDTGIGIPDDKLAIIFDKFTRLTPSYKGTYKGSGLGLYMVKNIIEQLGGTIQVSSEVGRGSCFMVEIPLEVNSEKSMGERSTKVYTNIVKKSESVELQSSNHALKTKLDATEQFFSSKILVVEDSPLAARSAKGILNKLGCTVDIAESAKEAMDCVEKNMYQLIFMDIGLPDKDGFEVTKMIRALPQQEKASVPIVVLTAHAGYKEEKNKPETGVDDVFTKPLTSDLAQNVLARWLDEKHEPKAGTQFSYLPDIDLDAGAKVTAGNKMAAVVMLAALADQLPEDMAVIKELYQKKNYSEVFEEVHKMLGGFGYCGVPKLQHVISDLYEELRKKDKSHQLIDVSYKKLEQAVSEFYAAFKKLEGRKSNLS